MFYFSSGWQTLPENDVDPIKAADEMNDFPLFGKWFASQSKSRTKPKRLSVNKGNSYEWHRQRLPPQHDHNKDTLAFDARSALFTCGNTNLYCIYEQIGTKQMWSVWVIYNWNEMIFESTMKETHHKIWITLSKCTRTHLAKYYFNSFASPKTQSSAKWSDAA